MSTVAATKTHYRKAADVSGIECIHTIRNIKTASTQHTYKIDREVKHVFAHSLYYTVHAMCSVCLHIQAHDIVCDQIKMVMLR